ncbi:Protein of unknown function DUF2650 family-containing protein [Aphelenchoides fujianensis]|nr:Protein of unknown function DUF2650 family-containing protein [Aphelenchoides fujianensis]
MFVKAACLLVAVLVLLQPTDVAADFDLKAEIEKLEPGRLRDSPEKCPDGIIISLIAPKHVVCPEANVVFYHTCCGRESMQCCVHLQDWLYALAVMLAALFLFGILLSIVRCCLGI